MKLLSNSQLESKLVFYADNLLSKYHYASILFEQSINFINLVCNDCTLLQFSHGTEPSILLVRQREFANFSNQTIQQVFELTL